jgi:hypothetical protein
VPPDAFPRRSGSPASLVRLTAAGDEPVPGCGGVVGYTMPLGVRAPTTAYGKRDRGQQITEDAIPSDPQRNIPCPLRSPPSGSSSQTAAVELLHWRPRREPPPPCRGCPRGSGRGRGRAGVRNGGRPADVRNPEPVGGRDALGVIRTGGHAWRSSRRQAPADTPDTLCTAHSARRGAARALNPGAPSAPSVLPRSGASSPPGVKSAAAMRS